MVCIVVRSSSALRSQKRMKASYDTYSEKKKKKKNYEKSTLEINLPNSHKSNDSGTGTKRQNV